MAEPSHDRYAFWRLLLDYLRALIWPIAVVVALIAYGPQIEKILTEREVDLFGLRIGERLQQIDVNVQQEIQDIRAQLAELRDAPAAEKQAIAERLVAQVESLEANLGREIRQIREETPAAAPEAAPGAPQPPTERASRLPTGERSAADYERQGFSALIERNATRALANFDAAWRAFPRYHNVEEIRNLLERRLDQLQDPDSPAWPDLYRTILTKHSWGMPQEAREAMRQAVGY